MGFSGGRVRRGLSRASVSTVVLAVGAGRLFSGRAERGGVRR